MIKITFTDRRSFVVGDGDFKIGRAELVRLFDEKIWERDSRVVLFVEWYRMADANDFETYVAALMNSDGISRVLHDAEHGVNASPSRLGRSYHEAASALQHYADGIHDVLTRKYDREVGSFYAEQMAAAEPFGIVYEAYNYVVRHMLSAVGVEIEIQN